MPVPALPVLLELVKARRHSESSGLAPGQQQRQHRELELELELQQKNLPYMLILAMLTALLTSTWLVARPFIPP